MGIKVRSRSRLVALVAGLALLFLTVPAQAVSGAGIDPHFVAGSSNCTLSTAQLSLTFSAPIRDSEITQGGVTITLTEVTRTSFSFSISNGEVHDVIVKGSGSNWYDYDAHGGPVVTDTLLEIPNGNKLNLIHFCYSVGAPIECGQTLGVSEDGTTGSFTRVGGDCTEDKFVVIDVVDDTIVFIPTGEGDATYTGILTFTKNSTLATPFALEYDRDDTGAFTVVPDCDVGPALPNETDTWCVVSASSAYQGDSFWIFTWNVYGEGDPKFH